jgi:hypothetical protein
MSQNGPYSGPPWSGGGSSDEPYTEPADPWGEAGAGVPEPAWGANPSSIPHQPVPYQSSGPVWGQTPPPLPPKRNTPIVALVVVLGLLIVVGLGTTAWLLNDGRKAKTQAQNTTSASAAPGTVQGSEDARFVVAGQCVVNQGTNDQPDMRRTGCASGTYEVLKVLRGKTTGEKDAEAKCSKVPGYTNWYFYDSELDELDFVLCLKKR